MRAGGCCARLQPPSARGWIAAVKPQERLPSDRQFGWTMAIASLLIGGFLYWRQVAGWPLGLTALASAFALASLIRPSILRGLNRLWFRFGLLLHRIVSPLILGLVFFLVVTPTALLRRRRSRIALGLDFDPKAPSYWLPRTPPGPDPSQLERQF